MVLHYTLGCLRLSCSLKNFGCCFLTGQLNSAKKKRLVRLAVLSGWHYQNKSYPVVEIGCDSSIIISFFKILFKSYFERLFKIIKKGSLKCPLSISCLIFFVTTTTSILNPPPPQPSFLSRLRLWFNFIVSLNVIFFCFQLVIIHYHTQKPTYLGNMGNCLSRKAEMPTSVVDSGDSLFFTFPPPPVNRPTIPTTPPPPHPTAPCPTPPPNWPSRPPKGIVWSLIWGTCYQNSLSFFPRN